MKRVIAAGLLATVLALALIAFARDVPSMAALFLLLGVANIVLDVSINSLYFKDESEANPNKKYGVYIFWMSAGPPAGLLLGAGLAKIADFRTMALAFAAVTAAALPAEESLERCPASAC
jgi:MFS family permease